MPDPTPLEVRRGLFFEEYTVGHTITTPGRTVTESDVVAFASFSGDWNPIHTDAVAAAQGPFGQRVAHGLWGLSVAVGLMTRLGFMEDTVLAFREIQAWKFSLPLFLGNTVHVHAFVSQTRRVPRLNAGLVTLQVELLNQDDKIVQQGAWSVLVKSRPAQ